MWREMSLRGVNTRPMDGALYISGDLMLFLLYAGEGEDTPVQWLEESIPFSGELELPESKEEMVSMVNVRIAHKELEAKPDYDGEMREFNGDVVLDLDIRLYQEEKVLLKEPGTLFDDMRKKMPAFWGISIPPGRSCCPSPSPPGSSRSWRRMPANARWRRRSP